MTSARFLELPVDVLVAIVKKLNHKDVLSIAATCRDLQAIAGSESVWIALCQPWKQEICVEKWRSQAASAKSLFRLLRTFSDLIGTWSSALKSLKGSLVFVTWGDFSLVGLRVVVRSSGISQVENVGFIRLFDLLGNPDGSTTAELVNRTSELRLSAAFSWSSPSKEEFHLDIQNQGSEGEALLGRLLHSGFAVGLGDQEPVLAEDEQVVTIGVLARRYLMRLAPLHSNGEHSQRFENPHGCRFPYVKLAIEPRRPGAELAGLWTGIYGPHGLEIISVTYDDEHITATKVTGDPNVPSTEVSFFVTRASENTEVSPVIQGLRAMLVGAGNRRAFEIVKVYKGKGRIAGYNFHNPQWVKGQLMVDANGTMAFLWEDVNFVITFQRLDLKAVYNGGRTQVLA